MINPRNKHIPAFLLDANSTHPHHSAGGEDFQEDYAADYLLHFLCPPVLNGIIFESVFVHSKSLGVKVRNVATAAARKRIYAARIKLDLVFRLIALPGK